MPKVVARLVSQWRNAAFVLHGEWQEAIDNDEPAPELAGPIGEVLTRHLDKLGRLRRSQFGGTLLASAEKDAMAALRAQPGKTGLKGDWVLEDESARWFLAELTGALDRRLAARPLAEAHRGRLRAALREEGDRILADVDAEPELAGIVDAQVRQMIAGRVDSRVDRTALRPEEFDGVSRELVQTLGLVCFLELLVVAHPDLLDDWRRAGTVDPRAVQAWVDLDCSASVPPAAVQRPGISTADRGPHCGRDGLKQARGVLSPHGGREQSRLPERLIELHRAQGPKTVAHVVVRDELWREGFPFALSNPRLRQAATLAWLLLDARQRPDALVTRLASVRGSMPVVSDRQARVMARRTLRGFDGTGGSSLWDAAVVGAAIQRDSDLALGCDGWNDALAAEIFGDTKMSPFLALVTDLWVPLGPVMGDTPFPHRFWAV